MTRALLDVNVLLALSDDQHGSHEATHGWLDEQTAGWASCAITQNGFLRIISQPRYPRPVPLPEAVSALQTACSDTDHEFWPCDVSLLDADVADRSALLGPKQVTDAYLLALAVAHGGRFVTLDRSVPLRAVPGATADHLLVL